MTQTTIIENTVFEQKTKMSKWKFAFIFALCLGGVFTILSIPALFLFGVLGFLFLGLIGAIIGKSEKKIFTTPSLFLMRFWMTSFYLATFFFMGYFLGKGFYLLIPQDAVIFTGTAIGLMTGIVTLAKIIRNTQK